VSWLPDDFFIGYPAGPEVRSNRPIGQGDVFEGVPIAGKTKISNGDAALKATVETAIVVASSCGMRKGLAGALNDLVHVAPVKRLASLAPGWAEPWQGHLHVLPLPGLVLPDADDEPAAANLARIGLCATPTLKVQKRLGCVSLAGMQAVKTRVATYFTRVAVASSTMAIGAHDEWHELSLWEHWTATTGDESTFQAWLDEENPNYAPTSRRRSLYDDLAGIEDQLEEAVSSQ